MKARLSARAVFGVGIAIVTSCATSGGSEQGVSDFFPGTPDSPPPDYDPPPGQDPPPSDFDDPSGSASCASLCNEIVNLCPSEETSLDECIAECKAEVPAACFRAAAAFVRCVAQNECRIDQPDDLEQDPNGDPDPEVCERELLAYITCLGPDIDPPDGDGEGGAGNI